MEPPALGQGRLDLVGLIVAKSGMWARVSGHARVQPHAHALPYCVSWSAPARSASFPIGQRQKAASGRSRPEGSTARKPKGRLTRGASFGRCRLTDDRLRPGGPRATFLIDDIPITGPEVVRLMCGRDIHCPSRHRDHGGLIYGRPKPDV